MLDVVEFSQALIRRPSITPDDQGCQNLISQHLMTMGFDCESLPFGNVSNLWARRGTAAPLFVFAGHTDVVPTGPCEQWKYPPFDATIADNVLYGRGAADMKSNIAAMLCAYQRFLQDYPQHHGSLAFLITSDEEGPSVDGTVRVVNALQQRGITPDYCIVGEASSSTTLGDTLKIGRRGTLSGHLTVLGKQGHIAYPQLADNPIHKACAALHELCTLTWDNGNADFDPTSFQCSNIHAGTGAGNIIPGELRVDFNFRYAPVVTAQQLQQRVEAVLTQHQLRYTLMWQHGGEPFYSAKDQLVAACQHAIHTHCGITPALSTSGGTSDGRFIAKICPQIVELGLVNASIHQIDEHANLTDLRQLVNVYYTTLVKLYG